MNPPVNGSLTKLETVFTGKENFYKWDFITL
jgi:hypothetical protein